MNPLKTLLFLLLAVSPAHAGRYLLVGNNSTTNPNGILRFDGITGAPKGYFVQPGAGGLQMPSQMILGPDGNVWVADRNAHAIKKFDLEGNYLGDLVAPGSILTPVALKIGPDGKLYVLSGGSERKLHRFSTSGDYEVLLVNAASTQINNPKDFIFMPETNDFLISSAVNSVARFNFTTGAFVSHYLNPTRSSTFINSPTGIAIGPDGNYWVASSAGTNKISRYLAENVSQRTDIFDGTSTQGGHQQIVMEDGCLFIANGADNNIIAYDPWPYFEGQQGNFYFSGGGAGDEYQFVLAGTNGLTNPRGLLFVDINDPPVVQTNGNQSVPGGGTFTLSASSSYDPEGVPLTYQWTQISGTPARAVAGTPPNWNTAASFSLVAPYMPTAMVFQLTISDGVKSSSAQVSVVVGPFVDGDGDGMPDVWEVEVGLNPNLHDANLDADHDGNSNRVEFLAGTHPLQAGSNFGLLGHELNAEGFTLRFSSMPERRYEVQYSSDLSSWLPVPGLGDVAATGLETTVIDGRALAGRRLYRVAVKPGGF